MKSVGLKAGRVDNLNIQLDIGESKNMFYVWQKIDIKVDKKTILYKWQFIV